MEPPPAARDELAAARQPRRRHSQPPTPTHANGHGLARLRRPPAAPQQRTAFATRDHPRRPISRPDHRRRDDADLHHQHLRPAIPGRSQGLRLRPVAESRRGSPSSAASPIWRKGRPAFAFASGLAAISHGAGIARAWLASGRLRRSVWRLVSGCSSACGGIARISISRMSIRRDLAAFEAAIRPNTRMMWIESPSNPLLKLADLTAIGDNGQAAAADLRGRQHVRHAVHPAAAHVRLRYRRAFDDEISQRPLAT